VLRRVFFGGCDQIFHYGMCRDSTY